MTTALSTRGRGAFAAPSGLTIILLPPRFLNVSGTCAVIVSPAAETLARVKLRPSCRPPPRASARRARLAGAYLKAAHPHVDPLDQQLHAAPLLDREQLAQGESSWGSASRASASVMSPRSARAAL